MKKNDFYRLLRNLIIVNIGFVFIFSVGGFFVFKGKTQKAASRIYSQQGWSSVESVNFKVSEVNNFMYPNLLPLIKINFAKNLETGYEMIIYSMNDFPLNKDVSNVEVVHLNENNNIKITKEAKEFFGKYTHDEMNNLLARKMVWIFIPDVCLSLLFVDIGWLLFFFLRKRFSKHAEK